MPKNLRQLAKEWHAAPKDAPWDWDDAEKVWRVCGGYWAPVMSKTLVRAQFSSFLDAAGELRRDEGFIKAVEGEARTIAMRDFSRTEGMCCFANGVFRAEDGELIPGTPDLALTRGLDYDLLPAGSECPHWMSLMLNMLGADDKSEAALRVIEAHIGLSLLGDMTFHRSIMILGPPGCGKTTLGRIINLLHGQPEGQFASGAALEPGNSGDYYRFLLRHWWGVVFEEIPPELFKNGTMFEAMSAHSGVPCRAIYGEPVCGAFPNKLLFIGNAVNSFQDGSGAKERRLIVINVGGSLTESQFDRHLPKKLAAERGAIARRCIDEAVIALRAGCYPMTDDLASDYEEMLAEANWLHNFKQEALEQFDAGMRKPKEIHDAYWRWCEHQRIPERDRVCVATLSRRLNAYKPWGFRSKKNNGERYIAGLKIKPEWDSQPW